MLYLLFRKGHLLILIFIFLSCRHEIIDTVPPVGEDIFKIPVVVHVVHHGEKAGEGYNISDKRIINQIDLLNNDFRKKAGTRGFNIHPDGADTNIEFVLARSTPEGTPTNGIVRVNAKAIDNPVPPNHKFDHLAYYSYWDYEQYLNIWIDPMPESATDIVLGFATGPDTDLPGEELLFSGEPVQSEGIIINSYHFGISELMSDYNLGRTLTHEAGHYLGLLHLWGNGDCETNDYCEDTPPVAAHNSGCPSAYPSSCFGGIALIENYMDYTADKCMNMFTHDQVERMHYVLNNSRARKSLLTSPGLHEPL